MQCIIAQSKEDKQRFEKLFDMPIIVGGNLKFNVALPAHDSAVIRAQWGFQESDYIAVWGSSRPGEEELMLAAFSEIKRTYPEFKLILAPRHPDRSDEVASLLEGYSYVRLSELDPGVHDFDILLIDSLVSSAWLMLLRSGDSWRLFLRLWRAQSAGACIPLQSHNHRELS